MIIITGGAGFIGSALAHELNREGIRNILLVDHLGTSMKWKNLVGLDYTDYLDKETFLKAVNQNLPLLKGTKAILHMGACSSTTEQNASYLMENNVLYTQILAHWALSNSVRFIYASSAATYGNGEYGYSDQIDNLLRLRPLNMYGYSKHFFDLWAKNQGIQQKIVGLKFFNVFGPNEYHKGDMKSMVVKAYEQIQKEKSVKLFKSYRSEYAHGEQKRDFIYIKDAAKMALHFLNPQIEGGLYNIGTGKARTWLDMMNALFSALKIPPSIEYIEMPEVIREKYQYFTEAHLEKTQSVWKKSTPLIQYSLEEAIFDYVSYLNKDQATLSY